MAFSFYCFYEYLTMLIFQISLCALFNVYDYFHLLFTQVVLDLGRRPEARFLGESGGQYLRNIEVKSIYARLLVYFF